MALIVSSLSILAPLVQGLAFNLPRQTSVAEGTHHDTGWTPRPTEPPRVHHELLRRDGVVYTILFGVDNVCGYISGRQGASHTCPLASSCALILDPYGMSDGPIACCDDVSCHSMTGCVDYTQYSNLAMCDEGCRLDDMVRKCTNYDKPYCRSIRIEDPGVHDYLCGSAPYDGFLSALTTWDGEDVTLEEREWFTAYQSFGFGSSSTSEFTLNPQHSTEEFSNSTTGAATLTPTSAISPPTTSAEGLSEATISIAALPTDKSQKPSPPVNAIVGGTIGGVALLTLIVAGIFVLRKKYCKINDNSKKDGLILKLTRTFTGKAELDSNQPILHEIYTPEVDQHKFDESLTKYHSVPTEAAFEPYRDKGSDFEATKETRAARLSVLSANRSPNSPAPTYASTEPAIVAEVPGSPVPTSMLRNSMLIQEVRGSPVPLSTRSPSPATESPGNGRPAPPSIRISTPPPEDHVHGEHLSPRS